jgi:hypothetical protein
MREPIVIGIAASRAGSGKTTVAQALVNNAGFVRLPLAEPLKRICGVILHEAGVSRFDAKRFLYHERNIVIPEIGVTGRHLLQTLGTDWGRRCISPHLWTTIWKQSLMQLRHAANDGGRDLRVVVDDVRFPGEADLIRGLGGFMWMVKRPMTRQEQRRELRRRFSPGRFLRSPQQLLPWKIFSSLHPSEGGLNRYPCFDARLLNDGTIHGLLQQVWKEASGLGLQLNGLGPLDAVPAKDQIVPFRRPTGPA